MKPYFENTIESEHIGIARYQKGLMLYDLSHQSFDLLISLDDFFALPYSTYLLDENGATLKINELGAKICGFHASDHALGRTLFEVSKKHTSQLLLDNCKRVLEQESVQIFDEFNMRYDGRSLQFLSFKFPCYDSKGQLQGTLGISIVVGEHPLAEAITLLTSLGILSTGSSPQIPQEIKLHLGGVSLTARENECLELTVKGFTAKEIAKKLSISARTVEEYLNQVKLKLGVSSKQRMIQKVLKS